jgi:hypothetical protein
VTVPTRRGPTRRTVLLGGLGLAAAAGAGGYELVQHGTLPGKYALARLTGACGAPPPPPSGPLPARHTVSFHSAYRQRSVHMSTVVPAGAGARGLGLVLALHGSGGDAARMAYQVARALASGGRMHFAVICVDGGDSYWHKRADGDDPVGMILHEVLPRARAAGLRTGRIGIAGESMGGYGALLLAERLGSRGVPAAGGHPAAAAVAAISPAIFGSYAEARAANRGSFDSPADFAGNDVLTGLAGLRGVPAWVACGADDPFEPQASLLRAKLGAQAGQPVPGGILPGCHDGAFWLRNMPAALQFAGAHLGEKNEEGR